jgi:hypothetical protein
MVGRNTLLTMFMNKNPYETPYHIYMRDVSAPQQTRGLNPSKMAILQHGLLSLLKMSVNTLENLMPRQRAI